MIQNIVIYSSSISGRQPRTSTKNLFSVDRDFQHGQANAVGVLIVNLGSPAAPTAKALRPYLGQFLSDPRVIEMSRPIWWLILHLFVLTFRPKKSAELYKNIWTDKGSPLVLYTESIARQMQAQLASECRPAIHVAVGMTYGDPSVPSALAELKQKGCTRIVVLPLFSHYSSTSTGACFDAVMKELMTWRWVPEVRTIHHFHDDSIPGRGV